MEIFSNITLFSGCVANVTCWGIPRFSCFSKSSCNCRRYARYRCYIKSGATRTLRSLVFASFSAVAWPHPPSATVLATAKQSRSHHGQSLWRWVSKTSNERQPRSKRSAEWEPPPAREGRRGRARHDPAKTVAHHHRAARQHRNRWWIGRCLSPLSQTEQRFLPGRGERVQRPGGRPASGRLPGLKRPWQGKRWMSRPEPCRQPNPAMCRRPSRMSRSAGRDLPFGAVGAERCGWSGFQDGRKPQFRL